MNKSFFKALSNIEEISDFQVKNNIIKIIFKEYADLATIRINFQKTGIIRYDAFNFYIESGRIIAELIF